jgi:hypothetical protein
VGVEYRRDGAEFDFLRIFLEVDISGGEFVLTAAYRGEFGKKGATLTLLVDDTVDAVSATINIDVGEEVK